ncbi:MAG: hypothetical protein JST93_11715 [Acidobacteria bacterium]|nr:hypothetical protein [Acidobacteriota bacterium]
MIGNSVLFQLFSISDLHRMGRPLPPAVTVLLPGATPGTPSTPNSRRLRNAVDTVFPQLLAQGLAHHECAQQVAPLLTLASDPAFRDARRSGVGLFLDGRDFFCFEVPPTVPETVIVSRHFHIRPLLPWLMEPREFVILELASGAIRTMRCREGKLSELRLPRGVPLCFDSMQVDEDIPKKNFENAISFGIASANEARRLQFFCTMLDRSLHSYLQDLGVPLILAGAEHMIAAYKKENTYPMTVPQSVAGNIDLLPEEVVIGKANQLIHAQRMEEAARHLVAMEEYVPGDRWSTSVNAVLRAAIQGRVWRLFVADGAEVRGDFLEAIGKPGKAPFLEEDLLNCAATETLLHGGEVFLVEPELLPSQAPVAGLFRYSLGPSAGEE